MRSLEIVRKVWGEWREEKGARVCLWRKGRIGEGEEASAKRFWKPNPTQLWSIFRSESHDDRF